MRHPFTARPTLSLVLALALLGVATSAQNRQGASALRGVPALPPPDGPVVLYTAEHPRIRVVPVVGGLSHPWGMAFRRNGDILITERDKGTLRVVRNGQLLDRDILGVPEVFTGVRLAGLMDIAVHPDDDSLVYLTYSKPAERDGRAGATVALARGRLDAGALTEVRDIFVADGWGRRDLGLANGVWSGREAVYECRRGLSVFIYRGVCAGPEHTLWEVAQAER